jgi:hypothetical protein
MPVIDRLRGKCSPTVLADFGVVQFGVTVSPYASGVPLSRLQLRR